MYNVSTSLLRFWEKEFTVFRPKKNRRGDRQFTQKDIKVIDEIYELVKIKGYTLEGAKRAMKKHPSKGLVKRIVLIERLTEIKNKLIKLREELN